MQKPHRPVALVILDGWGIQLPSRANAITQANTPNFDHYISTYPTVALQAGGEAAGLPWGDVGNSEVGHMTIGAGRIVYQELSRINAAISDGSFFSNPVLREAVEHVKKNKGKIHILGLVSPGGIHSHIDHLYALLEFVKKEGLEECFVHAILDGRDTSYASAVGYIETLVEKLKKVHGKIATLSGRFYTMDRDHHWDREERAYKAISQGISDSTHEDPVQTIKESYERGVTDEEFIPTVITEHGKPVAPVQNGDAVIFFNIRADRARQITQIFTDPSFDTFQRMDYANLFFATFTQYEKGTPAHVAFPPQIIRNCLAEAVSNAGLKQFHIAETEKYAHVTYFLNAGREEPFTEEKREMIPSPHVESYDKKPEMSAQKITQSLVKAIEGDTYDFFAVNFANADMVGHTGNMKATIKAIETLDQCFKQFVPLILQKDGAVIMTADHGNAEVLLDLQTGKIDKEHNGSPIPCIIIASELEGKTLHPLDVSQKDLSVLETSGMLSDVAPTVLDLLNIEKPADMTGSSLLQLHS
ncbi:2,3-bisphosphoglycerate-independent phosphoglycerate mutase [Candidatus Uhrbacteria bacterium]|nr:2,3-bisphosphoglycerate-independent phosphoglycerate mutase [Candidatus Uhrbacteria bacterium]